MNLLKSFSLSSLYIGGRPAVATMGDIRSPFGVSENFQNEEDEEEGFDVAKNSKEVNIAMSPGPF